MAKIITIKHNTEAFRVVTTDMSQKAIHEAIKTAGFTLSIKSIAALLSGEKTEAGDFKVEKMTQAAIDAELAAAPAPAPVVEAPAPAAGKSAAEKAKAAKDKLTKEQKDAGAAWGLEGQAPAAPVKGKGKTLTPEQAKLAGDVEKEIPTREATGEPKAARKPGVDWTKVLPQEPVAVREGSMLHRLFVRLCDPAGATKKQLMDEFNWSAGGLGGILHWEPKAKGYFLQSLKENGELRYHLAQIGTGIRYNPADVKVAKAGEPLAKNDLAAKIKAARIEAGIIQPDAPKPEGAAPAAPEAPKQEAAPTEPAAPKVKVTKEQRGEAAPMAGVNMVSKRRNPKPAQA